MSTRRERRRIARTHKWISEYRPTSTPVADSSGAVYAQHVYVCERCGHSAGTATPCSRADETAR